MIILFKIWIHSNYSAKPVGVPGAQHKSRLQYSKQADDPW